VKGERDKVSKRSGRVGSRTIGKGKKQIGKVGWLRKGGKADRPILSCRSVSRREFGIFAADQSARVKLLLNCCTVAAPQTQAPPTPLHPPSSRVRIVLVEIKGGARNVS